MRLLLASVSTEITWRNVHSSPISFQFIKDVYKKINYQAPYNDNQKDEVLMKLNSLPEKELHNYTTKKLSKLIETHRIKYGPFECVEQLLDLPKVEGSHIVKICHSLLNAGALTKEEKVAEDQVKKYRTLFSKNIIPKPDLDLFTSIENPTFVGVYITLQGIAFTKLNRKNKLLDWSIVSGVEDPTSQTAYQHRTLFSLGTEITNSLPDGDYYLLEELLPILPKDPFMKHKINLIKLRTTIMTLLLLKQKQPTLIHTIKPNVLDVLFSLKVGNERISMQEDLEQIISKFAVEVPEEAWETFNECNTQGKEYLTGSLLKAVAFNHVCVIADKEFNK